ncbi:sensor histidine kinase [Thermomonospora umbrina]|uniref:Oxygen sensor histidine kinase NreB n=1 Tax=Thermomonospora umbrina TaxID=111806 RepID=A0A3D9T5B5_9ACTN|nr:histidine kinase [Thermomonospora umbrina]REF00436.1 signal transduction histidine kinase [Thermomonospora umbrina]
MILPSPVSGANRRLVSLALLVAALCVAGTAGGLWATALTGSGKPPEPLNWAHWGSSFTGLTLALPGAALATRMPRHPLTWLLLAGGFVAVADGAGAAYATLSVLRHDGDLPLTATLLFVGARWGPMINVVIPVLLLYFPDGRLPSWRWRWPAACALAVLALGVLYILTVPWRVFSRGEAPAPGLRGVPLDPVTPSLPDGFWGHSELLFSVGFTGVMVTALAAFAARFRRSGGERRAQLRWMLLAGVAELLLAGLSLAVYRWASPDVAWWVGDLTLVASHAVLAAAILVAVARYRLYDVDLLLGRTLLYGSLAAAVIGIDVAVFTSVGAFIEEPLAAVTAAGVVAVLYAPLRLRLQRWVNRVLTGRGEPYDVVSALARRLEESIGPDELLMEVARVLSGAFGSPYVRVELDRTDGHTLVVQHGSAAQAGRDPVVIPFAYREVPIGRLTLVPRAGSRLSDADQRLLADVVRQAAAAARATEATEELQRARERLVTGIEEERRRLRRDLHDGLGPALAAAALKIETARNLAVRDPEAADGTLVDVRGDLRTVLGDVRRLVHDLRPPALDQFGLEGAVRRQAEQFTGGGLRVSVEVRGELAELPAAPEVAAYRIVAEALSNTARHAGARRCEVRLAAAADGLEVEVVDDGAGVAAGAGMGVGLVGMRERAEELGGRCTVSARNGGGTRVHAVIPYAGRGARAAVAAAVRGGAR